MHICFGPQVISKETIRIGSNYRNVRCNGVNGSDLSFCRKFDQRKFSAIFLIRPDTSMIRSKADVLIPLLYCIEGLVYAREDSKENLWISTENGICKFIPSEERFESYDERSITFPVRFSEAASTLTAKGSMLFGASGGVFIFNPDSIRKSSYIPPIVFSKRTNSDFFLFSAIPIP